MERKDLIALFLLMALLFLFPTNVLATDYYVKTPANGGNDASDGLSWATAKATVSAAMNLISNGAVNNVKVAAGVYNETVTFRNYDNIQLRGGYPTEGGETQEPWTNVTTIDANTLAGPAVSISYNASTNRGYAGLVIDGFTIKRATKSGFGGAGIQSYSIGLTVSRCIIESNTTTGTSLAAGGIYAVGLLNEYSSRVLRIDSCIIRSNSGPYAGAVLVDAVGYFQVVFVNTLIYSNSSTITTGTFGAGGVLIGTGAQSLYSTRFINCTIANNTASNTTKKVGGIVVGLDGYTTIDVYNSILWNPGADEVYARLGDTVNVTYSDVEGAYPGTGNINSNPSFVNSGTGNYRLNAGSPCIDKGSNGVSGLPATDLDGNVRIQNGVVDMGAYEASPPDLTPPDGSVSFDEGAYTNNRSVNLIISATDPSGVSQMCVSETPSCTTWVGYATNLAMNLTTPGDGMKTVYIWFKDSLNNATPAGSPFSDTIVLDTTKPQDGLLVVTEGAQNVLRWYGFSDTSGIASYKLVSDLGTPPADCDSGLLLYSGSNTSYTSITGESGLTIGYRVCAIDNAENTSSGAVMWGTFGDSPSRIQRTLTPYSSLQAAYNDLQLQDDDVIQARWTFFVENLFFDRPLLRIVIDGGYASNYSEKLDQPAYVCGDVTIGQNAGPVVMNAVEIWPGP